jgi:predicted Kef-type K+ transport protein
LQGFFIVIAFVFGFISRVVGLPPLVGFLTAGFFLNFMGYDAGDMLHKLADVGILLLLFSIGLKVQVKKLMRPQVWATACIHMGITTVVLGGVVFALGLVGLPYFYRLNPGQSFLLAFALSFSSTVFAVKILEEQEEMTSRHGQLAIGILVMQDLLAVLFITFSSGKFPSPSALALLCLFFLRKPLEALLNKSGHGELLVLLACILPVAGAGLFEAVGLKPDLGALVLGMLLAGTPKSDELAKSMLGFKDLFLVCFFLSIGMDERPQLEMILPGVILLVFIPFKTAFFYRLLTLFRVRARTALFASFNLANFSEFGLIVGSIGVGLGLLSNEWLIIIAVTVSLSMIAASPLGRQVSFFYTRFQGRLKKYESKHRLR